MGKWNGGFSRMPLLKDVQGKTSHWAIPFPQSCYTSQVWILDIQIKYFLRQ